MSGKIGLSGSTSIFSYSPGACPDITTFFIYPSDVPRNANVWGPVIAVVTEVMDSESNRNRAFAIIGDTPLNFKPTVQKL